MQSTIGSTTQANIPIAQARAGEFVASTGRESYVAWSATGNTSCHTNENQVDRDCDPTAIAGKFHSNQQYSVTAITNSTAGIVERYAYQAYGEPTILDGSANVISSSSISNRYTYTGREWDGTVALYHFRARWMSGLTGRFLSRDPIGYAGGLNLQSFLGGNVFGHTDPTGNEENPCMPKLVGCPRPGNPATGRCQDGGANFYSDYNWSLWGAYFFGWYVAGVHDTGAIGTTSSPKERGGLSRATWFNERWTNRLAARTDEDVLSAGLCDIQCNKDALGNCIATVSCSDRKNPDSGGRSVKTSGGSVDDGLSRYWHTAVSWSISYNGAGVSITYKAQAGFSMAQPSIETNVGGTWGGANLVFPAGQFQHDQEDTGTFAWFCDCKKEPK